VVRDLRAKEEQAQKWDQERRLVAGSEKGVGTERRCQDYFGEQQIEGQSRDLVHLVLGFRALSIAQHGIA
jgi:hypothetical protein